MEKAVAQLRQLQETVAADEERLQVRVLAVNAAAAEQARSQLQISVLEYMRVTGTLRVDPESGTIGRVMDRAELQANNSIQGR